MEPNPWLRRLLWHQHLEGKIIRQLTKAIEPAETSRDARNGRELGAIIEGFRMVISAAQGITEWQGDKVFCQKIRLNMDRLREMIHGLVEEARTDLMTLLTLLTLLMLKVDAEGEVEEKTLTQIEWETMKVCPGEERVGWSFLKNTENRWSVDGEGWLLQRVAQEPR